MTSVKTTAAHSSAEFIMVPRDSLGQITDLSVALRSGGPATEDLQALSDALDTAIDIAHGLLEAPAVAPMATNSVSKDQIITDVGNLIRAAWMLCDNTGNGNPPEVDQTDWDQLSVALAKLDQLPEVPGVIAGPAARAEHALTELLSLRTSSGGVTSWEVVTLAIPVGWFLVPEVPTEDQMNAGLYQSSHDAEYGDVCQAYMDMVRTRVDLPITTSPPIEPGGVTDRDRMVRRVLAWVREDVLPAYGITHNTRASDPEMIEGLTAALSSLHAQPDADGHRVSALVLPAETA